MKVFFTIIPISFLQQTMGPEPGLFSGLCHSRVLTLAVSSQHSILSGQGLALSSLIFSSSYLPGILLRKWDMKHAAGIAVTPRTDSRTLKHERVLSGFQTPLGGNRPLKAEPFVQCLRAPCAGFVLRSSSVSSRYVVLINKVPRRFLFPFYLSVIKTQYH